MATDGSESLGLIENLANICGSSAPALRLLISVLLGYPFAFLYRKFFFDRNANHQHLYFALSGIYLCYFNYGFDVLHIIGCILVLYILLVVKGGTRFSVGAAFLYFMVYLILGYYYTETDDYDIKWTMPQCVFTLKAIGLVFDVYDGKKDKSQHGDDRNRNALNRNPSLLEIAGYSFFYGTCLVGPQMPFIRYLHFVNKEGDYSNKKLNSLMPGLTRAFVGLSYLTFFLIGNSFLPFDYIFADSFKNKSFIVRFLLITLWGKLGYSKYLISWILSEGSCILTGVTYNGKDENGKDRWDGCANVNLVRFETATKFNHVIQGFNITTNKWAATYIYKRLRFLGNKFISQAVTLAFLAAWHGLHFTYYLTFFLEFLVMKFEHDMEHLVSSSATVSSFLKIPLINIIKIVLQKIYVTMFFSYCLIPFVVIQWDLSNQLYSELYFIGHVIYFGWMLIYPVINYFRKSGKGLKSAKYQNGVESNKHK
ncbi:hypothetical protein CHUAL_000904 [Chamberlinius hualienensis]